MGMDRCTILLTFDLFSLVPEMWLCLNRRLRTHKIFFQADIVTELGYHESLQHLLCMSVPTLALPHRQHHAAPWRVLIISPVATRCATQAVAPSSATAPRSGTASGPPAASRSARPAPLSAP